MSIDVGIITETHLKRKHLPGFESIDGYTAFRRDREGGRRGGGVMIYIRNNYCGTVISIPGDHTNFELLWIKLIYNS